MAIGRSSPGNSRYGLKGAYLPESKLSQPNTGPRPPSFSCQARFDDVQGKIYFPDAMLALAMISTPGHRVLRRRQRRAPPAWYSKLDSLAAFKIYIGGRYLSLTGGE